MKKRRTAEETRALILDAAEKRVVAAGPDALRLQEIAADVGISHPAILHHFGSREGLMKAVVERTSIAMQADLLASFVEAAAEQGIPDGAAMLNRVFETLADKGHGRLIAWLALTGWDKEIDSESSRLGWKAITDATHAARAAAPAGANASYEDTQFTVILSWLAVLGLAITGPSTFRIAGLTPSRKLDQRFNTWLAKMLLEHLERPTMKP